MIGFALVTCAAAFFYAVILLLTFEDGREMRLHHLRPMPPNREAWLRQRGRLRKESGR